MERTEALKLLDSLYWGIDGYRISNQERLAYKNTDSTLTYGEITFPAFASMLSFVDVKENEIFYDLGCGTGKPLFASSILEPFKKCIGIELLDGLYKKACEINKKFDNKVRPNITQAIAEIAFVHNDMFNVDITDGDVFYVSATCFSDNMMISLAHKIRTCKIGSRFIILSKGLPLNELFLLWHGIKKMSWGDCTVWIYRKVR